jgi:undecaprenyl-diphosphatase
MTARPLDRSVGRAEVRTALVVIGGAAAAFLLLTLAVLAHAGPLVRLDEAISAAARHAALAYPAWRTAMATITVTGSTAVLGPVAAMACLVLLRLRRWQQACVVAVGLLVAVGIRLLLVAAIARPRPTDRLAPSTGWSFPSGHSTASAAAALLTILVCRPMLRHLWSRILLTCVAVAWAVMVGVSRVALVVHWPSDVLGAWLLALTVVPSVALGLRFLFRRGPGGIEVSQT